MESCDTTNNDHRCDICKTAIAESYCDFCNVRLCKPCIGEHISNEYDVHKIVSFQERQSTVIFPKCIIHSNKICEVQCKECNEYICTICSASKIHKGHNLIVLEYLYKTKKENIEKEGTELKQHILSSYEDTGNDLESEITNLDEKYDKIKLLISKQCKELHREIDKVVNNMKYELSEIKVRHRGILMKQLIKIKEKEMTIKEKIAALKEVEECKVVSLIIKYTPTKNEFSKVPSIGQVSLPLFHPKPINGEQMFGYLVPCYTSTDESEKPREFLNEPEVINWFNTGCTDLCCVSFYSETNIWIGAKVNNIKCFDSDGKCINEITTQSGEVPNDIAITSDGDLLYCEENEQIVNKVHGGHTEEVTSLQGWTPTSLCVTTFGDLLVVFYDNRETQSKIIRYSGARKKHTIQFDEKGYPLFSGNSDIKYITENRNENICVADWGACAVVVVNHIGKLRFRYRGHSCDEKENPFLPSGITTNSQSQILTADCDNQCIHILDENGKFLRYINIVHLNDPFALCVDNFDNLFVAEYFTWDVKVIKYLK